MDANDGNVTSFQANEGAGGDGVDPSSMHGKNSLHVLKNVEELGAREMLNSPHPLASLSPGVFSASLHFFSVYRTRTHDEGNPSVEVQ